MRRICGTYAHHGFGVCVSLLKFGQVVLSCIFFCTMITPVKRESTRLRLKRSCLAVDAGASKAFIREAKDEVEEEVVNHVVAPVVGLSAAAARAEAVGRKRGADTRRGDDNGVRLALSGKVEGSDISEATVGSTCARNQGGEAANDVVTNTGGGNCQSDVSQLERAFLALQALQGMAAATTLSGQSVADGLCEVEDVVAHPVATALFALSSVVWRTFP